MSLILITIIFVIIFVLWSRYSKSKNETESITKNFPSPPRVPILGFSNLSKYGSNRDPYDMFREIMEFPKDHGPNVVFHRLFNQFDIFVTGSEAVETLLNEKNLKKSTAYEFVEPWLGEGLLTAFGPKWFRRRKIITPTFHFKILEQFLDVFHEQDKIFVKKLDKYIDANEECNIYQHFTALALDNICETAMGASVNAQDDPNSEYVQSVVELGEIVFRWFFNPVGQLPFIYNWFTADARRKKYCIEILHKFTNAVIKDRRNQLKLQQSNGKKTLIENEVEGRKQRLSFLDMLLQSKIDGEPLSDSDIREEVDTFMFEGHDTTTSGLTFAVYNIAMHPEVQEKIFDELRLVYGNDASVPPSFSSIQELKYLEKVIKESQRMHPSVPVIGRKTVSSIQIDGVTIPAGVNLQILIYVIHRNEKVFPDPEKFDPERFDENKERSWGAYDYIPFSAGGRNCVGQKYAMLELKTVLSTLFRNFKVVATEKTRSMTYQTDLVLRPRNGVFVKLERRQYS